MKRALLLAGGTVGGLGAVLSITPPQLGSQGMANLASSVNGAESTMASAASSQSAKAVVPQATSGVVSASASSAGISATQKATVKKPTTTKKTTATKKATAVATATKRVTTTTPTTNTQATTPTPTPVVTKAATPAPAKTQTQSPASSPSATSSQVSGTFTGSSFDAAQGGGSWGRVTVTVTMANGSIVNISAIQSPSSRGQYAFSTLTPTILNQKMSVQSIMAISPASLQSQIQGQTGASYSAKAYWESLQSALAKTGL